ncbi:hypothetical protein NCAS_0C01450 [Naumovozyma castellii]|uniref:Uncharacterized protein n=1 Tax=Naumovozyma castellii TaxID=27288 RepID=G0VCC6_NAUCA|nr:hypothetical protein NCAS_0C01450 [Naumovozyma castellii CBS 4309]CCC69135.1 hypothetical protein NCAS_0C01450 [Naumovozyma castellii CBS 4309]
MTQSSPTVSQKYKLSLVSGGKPILPRASFQSSCDKNIACLTNDQLNYIVPFNNKIKIFNVETRQCIKTLKFSNNKSLAELFTTTSIAHIALGDLTQEENKLEDKFITVFTKDGHVIVLNFKGKLVESPKILNLNLIEKNEMIYKVFQSAENPSSIKILTIKGNGTNTISNFHLYQVQQDFTLQEPQETFNNVILTTWSSNDTILVLLSQTNATEKTIHIESIFDDSCQRDIPLDSIISKEATKNLSSTSKYISSMAIDNNANQLALGFVSGVINIVSLDDSKLQSRLLKWHIDSVLSLSFNQDGTYLLSGGWEKVLVFWQLSTNLQQFLPRLNGIIIDCSLVAEGKYYSLGLQMIENNSNSDYQLILLNSTDLISKLSINGPLPTFNSTVKNVIQPISSISTRSSNSLATINSSKKKQLRKLLKLQRQDFTSNLEINPLNKQLYFPHISAVQIFDFYKNDQVDYQYMTSSLTNSMGKVKSELNLKEPIIANLKLTKDGKWLITYEIEYPPTDLLSSKDVSHTLKFWSKDGTSNEDQWKLRTKILNPHGLNVPITNMIVAPLCVGNDGGCLTADNNGGLKYWSFNTHESNWCLSKIALPNFNHFSNSVSLAWSHDGSLILHGFDDKLTIVDFETFSKLDENEFVFDSEIQTIKFVNDSNLIVATKTTLSIINLLMGKIINSFDLYPFINGIYKNGHLDRLIACDEVNGKVALVINQQVKGTTSFKSNILVFNADLSSKIGSFTHDEYISWIGWNYDSDFIFLDIESRLGVVGTTVNTEMLDEVNKEGILDGLTSDNGNAIEGSEFTEQLRKLSSNLNKRSLTNEDEDQEDIELEFVNGAKNEKGINMNSFISMFENIQNVQMDTLFDSVIKTLT